MALNKLLTVAVGLAFSVSGVTVADVTLSKSAQLGPRPFYLVDAMEDSRLKRQLQHCAQTIENYRASDFSIGHRGAPLQFPEHTRESYVAAARMGAGMLECDVTFTRDLELVCRHAQCDLHATTNIIDTKLASKCAVPPAFDEDGKLSNAEDISCCTSDITLAEFRTLFGKMDAADKTATTVEGFLGGTADFRTDLYATRGTLLTHAESIELFTKLGRKMTPELKSPAVDMPFKAADGTSFTQEDYAKKMIGEYRAVSVPASDVWPQSFNYADVLYWVGNEGDFGRQAVYLIADNASPQDDDDGPINGPPPFLSATPPPLSDFVAVKDAGVNIIAPPIPALVKIDAQNGIVPSDYGLRAREAGLGIISWTAERSGRVNEDIKPDGAFYYATIVDVMKNDGDILRTIDVLVQQVGIVGLFSDWPATTTFYANCKSIPGAKGPSIKSNNNF